MRNDSVIGHLSFYVLGVVVAMTAGFAAHTYAVDDSLRVCPVATCVLPSTATPNIEPNPVLTEHYFKKTADWTSTSDYPALLAQESAQDEVAAVNERIEKFALARAKVNEADLSSEGRQVSSSPEDKPFFYSQFEAILLDENVVSFRFDESTSGGAHPRHDVATFTCRRNPVEVISLKKIFVKPTPYTALRQLLVRHLNEDYKSELFAELEELPGEETSLSRFVVTEEGIEFYFTEGTFLPGAIGQPRTLLPWEEIRHLLSARTPVKALAAAN